MHMTIVPVLYDPEANLADNLLVELAARGFATGSDGELRYTRDVLPIGDLNVKLREPYYTSADRTGGGTGQILDELEMLRHLEAGEDEYYHGIFALPEHARSVLDPRWPAGIARVGGHAAVSEAFGKSVQHAIVAHELGHNLSLLHARCDVPPGHPAYFPYPDGSIGAWGHRFIAGDDTGFGRLFDPEIHSDVMEAAECPNWRDSPAAWISDYNFTKALDYRVDLASAQAPFAQRETAQQTLLLWGGIQEGEVRLEPAFVHDARLKLPAAPGPYQLEGLDAEGRRLFSFSFTPDALAHGGSSFLFAIPFEPESSEDLDRITLTGPGGSTALDRDTGGRAALIVDRASGRVRTIARDWPVGDGALPAAMAVDAQVEVIRGLPRR